MQGRLIGDVFRKGLAPLIILALISIAYFVFYSRLELVLLRETVESLDKWIFAVFATIIAFSLQRVSGALLGWYALKIAKRTAISLDEEFLPLIRRVLNILIWTIVILMVLGRFGINTNGLIAALGVGSLAIALAAQDTIANIISGFLIMIDRPYRLDDTIKLPSGEKVKVLDIGLRRSKFLSEDGAIIFVPNLALSKSKIVNYTYGDEAGK